MTITDAVVEAGLPDLPRPDVCFADHSYPAYSAKQMQDYARAAVETFREADAVHLRAHARIEDDDEG